MERTAARISRTLSFAQLKQHLWSAADILRGSIDSSDYKSFILGLLFVKRLSDRFEEEAEKLIAGGMPEEVAWTDTDEHQFFVPNRARWSTIQKQANNIGETLNKACAALEEQNGSLEGVLGGIDYNDEQKLGDGKNRDTLPRAAGPALLATVAPQRAYGRARPPRARLPDRLVGPFRARARRRFVVDDNPSGGGRGQEVNPSAQNLTVVLAHLHGMLDQQVTRIETRVEHCPQAPCTGRRLACVWCFALAVGGPIAHLQVRNPHLQARIRIFRSPNRSQPIDWSSYFTTPCTYPESPGGSRRGDSVCIALPARGGARRGAYAAGASPVDHGGAGGADRAPAGVSEQTLYRWREEFIGGGSWR